MAYFTVFQDRLFPTAELPKGEREKMDEFLRLLEDSGVGEIIHKETQKDMVVRSYQTPLAAYEVLYGLEHPNLPIIYDVIACEDGQIVLEEFVEGITVAQVLETGKYHYLGAKKVLKQVCLALATLHQS